MGIRRLKKESEAIASTAEVDHGRSPSLRGSRMNRALTSLASIFRNMFCVWGRGGGIGGKKRLKKTELGSSWLIIIIWLSVS